MRRFSQRSSLVTLSEINITPLLDLAFVLLIIFVITTPLLEQGIPLKLPDGTGRPDKLERGDIRTVEISPQGIYMLNKRSNSLDQIEALKPERILISPGPCSPRESGLSNEVIRNFAGRVPTFGVLSTHTKPWLCLTSP